MATAAPENITQKTASPSSLSLQTVDNFIKRVELFDESIATNPALKLEERVVEGIRGKELLRLLQFFVAENWKDLGIDPSIIDLNLSQFLKKLLPALKSKKEVLLKEAGPVRTLEEIVEEYQKEQTATTEQEKSAHKKHIDHLHENIEKATKNSQKKIEAALIAEHIKTTEALTSNLTEQVENATNAIAGTIFDSQQTKIILDSLSLDSSDEGRQLFTNRIANEIRDRFQQVTSDVDAQERIEGIVKGVFNDVMREQNKIIADPRPLDTISREIATKHKEQVLKAARAIPLIDLVFKQVGGEERLRALALAYMGDEKQMGLIGEELLEALKKAGISTKEAEIAKGLMSELEKTLREGINNNIDPAAIPDMLQEKLLALTGVSHSRYASLSPKTITALTKLINDPKGPLLRNLHTTTSLTRLIKLSRAYPHWIPSLDRNLYSQLGNAPLPTELLWLRQQGKFGAIPQETAALALGSSLKFTSLFNAQMKEYFLLSLLGYDAQTLTELEKNFKTLALEAKKLEGEKGWIARKRAEAGLMRVEQVREFLKKYPTLNQVLRNYWKLSNLANLLGPLDGKNKNFLYLLENLIEVEKDKTLSVKEKKKALQNLQKEGRAEKRAFQKATQQQPSLGYFSTLLTSWQPHFPTSAVGYDVQSKNGRPHIASLLPARVKQFASKSIFGKAFKGAGKKLAARVALGSIPVIGPALAAIAPFFMKHWKKIVVGIGGGVYFFLQSMLGNIAQVVSFLTHVGTGAAIGFVLTGGNPLGALAGGTIGGFIGANGGIGAFLGSIGNTITGFLGGMTSAGAGIAAGVGGLAGGILSGGILATSAIIAPVIVLIGSFLTIVIAFPNLLQPQNPTPPPTQTNQAIPGLTLSKTGDTQVENDTPITYTITATYTGNLPVTITDQVPANTTFIEATGNFENTGSSIVWKLDGNEFVEENGGKKYTFTLVLQPTVNDIIVTNKLIATAQGTGNIAGGSCPTQAELNANTNSSTCHYLNPGIDIFNTNISQAALDSYTNNYGHIFVSAGLGDLNEFKRRVDLIVSKSKSVGLNPAIFLGYWKTESLFGTITPSATFGCGGNAQGSDAKSFEVELDCAVGLSSAGGALVSRCTAPNNPNKKGCSSSSTATSFDDFVEKYAPVSASINICTHTYNQLVGVAEELNSCTVKTTNSSTGTHSIVLDPGHGSPDLTPERKNEEGALNLIIANKVKTKLETDGYTVSLSHNGNIPIAEKYAEFAERVRRIDASNAEALIAIHFDNGSYDFQGPRAYYNATRSFATQNQKLAQSIGQALSQTTGLTTADELTGLDTTEDVASCSGPLYILGAKGERTCPENPSSEIQIESDMPGTLVEMFIPRSYNDIAADTGLVNQIVDGYVQGIENYFNQ